MNLKVIKIGGKVMDDPAMLNSFLHDLSLIEGPKILVHGGGKKASEYLVRMGIEPVMIDGRRVTDAETLDVVTMIYAGLINKNIVARLQANGLNGLGMSGADLNLIVAHKRAVKDIDYGFAGDIDKVNTKLIKDLLLEGVVPVICSVTHDGKGQLLNTNADTIASSIGVALCDSFAVSLIYCFEIPGVMKDMEHRETFELIDRRVYDEAMGKGIFSGGILPKLANAFEAIDKGVTEVVICHSGDIRNLGTTEFKGTRIIE